MTSFHTVCSSVFPLPPPPPLSVTVMLSQTYDDIDLENEPWYKFFSELEFGRPVSQGHSYSPQPQPCRRHTPTLYTPPMMSPPIDWVGLVVLGMWYLLGAVTPPSPSCPPNPCDRLCYVSALLGFLVWWLAGTEMFTHKNLDNFISVGFVLHLVPKISRDIG